MTTQVQVELGERSYVVHIGPDLLSDLWTLLQPHVRGSQIALISNPTVMALYGERVLAAFPASMQCDVFEMPDGEAYKSLEVYGQVMDFLMQRRHNRTTCVVALGGGVVGDLAGFVAATYQRGVDFVQIPTTLLAQVDSSVGGKTAVNHPAGKNMIGAFYQPRCVVIDTRVLETLPHREYLAGVAEVVKYGAITDVDFFTDLESNVEALRTRNLTYLASAIQRSVELKAQVVAADEREGGLRAILNFGHTFGHAIEQLSGYGVWLHGEAVSIGMVMAAQLCASMGILTDTHAQRIRSLLDQSGLPVTLVGAGNNERLQVDEFIQVMAMDKKAVDGQIRLVLLDRLGHAVVTSDYDPNLLHHVVEQHL